MERLTKMQEDGTVYYTNENISFGDCLRKLYSLEELEEKIGISLIDYFGLKGKDIYIITGESYREYLEYNNNNIDNFFEEELLDYTKCETIRFLCNDEIVYTYYEDYYCYPIAEIGLTWFLTYEEALRKIEELQDIQEKQHNIEVVLQKDRKNMDEKYTSIVMGLTCLTGICLIMSFILFMFRLETIGMFIIRLGSAIGCITSITSLVGLIKNWNNFL